jgi:hypothetical protein
VCAHWGGLFQFGAPDVVEPKIEPDPMLDDLR